MPRLQIVDGVRGVSLHRKGQLARALDSAVQQDLNVALTGVNCGANHLVIDHLDNVEAKSSLHKLFVCIRRGATRYHHGSVLFEAQSAPSLSKLGR